MAKQNIMKNSVVTSAIKNASGIFFFLVSILFQHQKVSAQTWSDVGGGMCDWVNASVVYNGELIVGGRFTCAGGVTANHIAKWNGTSWSALGAGVDGWVNALTVYNGKLIAGGQFSTAGSTPVLNLAQWNGTSWTDVNGDVGSIVSALTVYNNDLIVGGYFTDADGFSANYIVGYDGNGWFNLGSGMGGGQGQVMALNVYGSELIAAGFFTTAGGIAADHIAKWNGISWSTLGTGIAWITYSLGTYNGDLIAGGLFSNAGSVTANSIAKWNGSSWSSLGSGMGATAVGYNYVFALADYNGSLYAGGMYLTAGGITANGIAKWDGNTWTDLQGGTWYGGSNAYGVNSLCVYANDLFAGGLFTSAGSTGVAHLAKWNEPAGCNTSSIIFPVACDENYVSPSGHVWNGSGTYIDTIPNANGCDSIIVVNLTMNYVDTLVSQFGNTLNADGGGFYQWLDCNNNYSPINGAASQSFTATVNGSYAVAITQNGCSDTSLCYDVTGIGINEIEPIGYFRIFPNPANEILSVQLSKPFENNSIEISNSLGQIVFSKALNNISETINLKSFDEGLYFVRISCSDIIETKKLVLIK
ncbi:hypothetical protein LBMAG27_25310 [Bacteroidota bacterium]|nr:hypothetical protein LBMAG27_25310 [Bacteroidota bacterium]